jgi:hypothetical protein
LVRTGELLAARSLDGGRQFFTRAFDFGYSKNAEETFRFWPREELLEDLTWVVRTFRPQVIVSVFSGTPRDGHGHHQVAGVLAHEVFEVAGDPSRFPEQLRDGAQPWAPLKLYRLTRPNLGEGTTGIETGALDPLLGRSQFQVAMDSRSQHRSQDMGVAQPMGPRRSSLALVESRVEAGGSDEIFSGVDTALVVLGERLPERGRGGVAEGLGDYRAAVAAAGEALGVASPWESVPHLSRALEALRSTLGALGRGGPGGAGSTATVELQRILQERLPLVQEALLRAAGVVVEVRLQDDLLVPGETVGGVVELWNGGPYAVEDATARLELPSGWRASGEMEEIRAVSPGTLARWSFQLQVPGNAGASQAYYMTEARDGELYRWPGERSLWGSPANPDLLHGKVSLRIGETGAVEVWKPARFTGVDKASGEFVKPVQVVPALSVSVDPTVMAWPSGAQGSREFHVTVQSQSDQPLDGLVSLQLPSGWDANPKGYPVSFSEAGIETTFTFVVTRFPGSPDGEYLVTARVLGDDGSVFQSGVSLVDYPHIRRSVLFPPAQSRVSVFPASLPEGIRVGYVMGSGDGGPEAIRQMGARVDLLGPETLRAGSFGEFDVIVLGIRAYETRPELGAANDRLLDFVRAGGTLLVQYNKYEFPRGGFAPFQVEMNRPHDRVSDETAPVRILDPSHPVFQSPNPIGSGDFDGWVQERGLYFLRDWGPEFTPLLEMADPGEGSKQGGLLVAPLGEGVYAYTGLAFFRQFPEGVPGAYRLFANLLSLRADDLR